MTHDRCLIIGLGNTCRGDDGLGPAIAERLRMTPELAQASCQILSLPALDITLADTLAGFERVILVDARVDDNDDPVVVRRNSLLDSCHLPHNNSHSFSIDDLLRLTRELHGSAPMCYCVLPRAYELMIAEGLSERAEAAADEAMRYILELVASEMPGTRLDDILPEVRPTR